MNNLLEIVKNYDLIGIGEEIHGEMISWKIRYKIIKYLTKYYDKVYIFCEIPDIYVNGLNNKNVKFIFNEDGFFPNIMSRANLTKEHLYYTKKFNKLLPKVKFYGIDVQIVEFNYLYKKLSSELYNIIEKYKDEYLNKCDGKERGKIRNKCNAFIINDLMKYINNKYDKSNNKFIYLGHNEHISLNCNATNKNKKYLTEGYYLKNICNIKYLSIATFSNEFYSVHEYTTLNNCKIKLLKFKNKKLWDSLFKKNENYKIIANSDNIELKMDDYAVKDFDYVICVKNNGPMTLL
jgi:hypothetical protein